MAGPVVEQVWTRKDGKSTAVICAVSGDRVAINDSLLGLQAGPITDLTKNYTPPTELWRNPQPMKIWAAVLPNGTMDFFRIHPSAMDRAAAVTNNIPAIVQCDLTPDLTTLEIL